MTEIILCDCRDGCQCAPDPGPALHVIERDGKQMNVCSRCIFPEDTVTGTVNHDKLTMHDLMEYDPIAAFMAMMGADPTGQKGDEDERE